MHGHSLLFVAELFFEVLVKVPNYQSLVLTSLMVALHALLYRQCTKPAKKASAMS